MEDKIAAAQIPAAPSRARDVGVPRLAFVAPKTKRRPRRRPALTDR
jgi:hypothetical protein